MVTGQVITDVLQCMTLTETASSVSYNINNTPVLSRRNAILCGVGSVAAATYAGHETRRDRLVVDGVVAGRSRTFAVDVASGQVSLISTRGAFDPPETQQLPEVPEGLEFADRSVHGDLLVRDLRTSDQPQLLVLNSAGRAKYRIATDGPLSDAKFSATGREITFIETSGPLTRAVTTRADGGGRRVLGEVGVSGTPTLVLETGEVIPGYLQASQLAARLGLIDSRPTVTVGGR